MKKSDFETVLEINFVQIKSYFTLSVASLTVLLTQNKIVNNNKKCVYETKVRKERCQHLHI
jgi:hypothetical protein